MLKLIAAAWIGGIVCYASREFGCWATGNRHPLERVQDDVIAAVIWPALAIISIVCVACRLVSGPK